MKKYSWIMALLLALTLAFIGCPTDGGGGGGGGGDDNTDPVKADPIEVAFTQEMLDVWGGGEIKATDDGTGFTFTYGTGSNNSHGNAVAMFKVDLGTAKVRDYEKVTFTFTGIGGDLGPSTGQYDKGTEKGVNLLAAADTNSMRSFGGADGTLVTYIVNAYTATGSAGGATINAAGAKIGTDQPKEIDLELEIAPTRPQASNTGEVWFSFYLHASAVKYEGSTATTEQTSFKITNVTFVPLASAVGDLPVDEAAIRGVTRPATGATPVESITDTAQYTGTVTWDGTLDAEGKFAEDTVYTATITLTAKEGFTFNGVAEDFFTVAGADATNPANSGVVTAVFPATMAGGSAFDIAEGLKGLTNEWGTNGSMVADTDTGIITRTGTGSSLFSVAIPGVTPPVAANATIKITYIADVEKDEVKLTAKLPGTASDLTPATYIDLNGDGEEHTYDIPATRYGAALATLAKLSFQDNSAASAVWKLKITKIEIVAGEAAPDSVVDIAAIHGVDVPNRGETPTATTITATEQYTGTIAWTSGTDTPLTGAFAPKTVYTATITLTALSGYTFEGLAAPFAFTVVGASSVTYVVGTPSSTCVVKAVFPETTPEGVDNPITHDEIELAAPVTGGTPATSITSDTPTQYTGTVEWDPAVTTTFAASTVYTATITLEAEEGYTYADLDEDFFSVAGATSVTFDADTGEITVVFPKTDPDQFIVAVDGTDTSTTSVTAPSGTVKILDNGYTYTYGSSAYRNGYVVFKIDLGGALSGFASVNFTYDTISGDGNYKPVYVYASATTFSGNLETTATAADLVGSVTSGNPVSNGNANSVIIPIDNAGTLTGELYFVIAVPCNTPTAYKITNIKFVK